LPQSIATLHAVPNWTQSSNRFAIAFVRFLNAVFSPRASQPILGLANPFQGTDQGIATWFHDWLTPAIVSVLHMLTEVGSGKSIEIVLFALVLFFMWKRWSHLS
jgi:hypothetical protein